MARAEVLARNRTPAVEFRLADAATAAFARDFDLVVSRFGVMFFDQPIAAFRNIRSAMKPGGRLAFVCWRGAAENDWTRLPMGAPHGLHDRSGAPVCALGRVAPGRRA